MGDGEGDWEIRVVGGVDISDPEAVGPAELDVWTRFVGAPDDPAVSQALLAFATDGFLIGTAMRPHPGVGQAQAHRTLSTGVISHTLTFHEPVVGRRVDAALAPQPLRRSGPQLRPGRRVPGRRAAGGLVRAGRHDPPHARAIVREPVTPGDAGGPDLDRDVSVCRMPAGLRSEDASARVERGPPGERRRRCMRR